MGKPSAKAEVTDYRMSLHYGLCYGPGTLLAIYAGEKECWSGSVDTLTPISINRPDLYGGQKKEGGVSGVATFLPGNDDQVIPAHLASRLGLTPETCPAYRGIATVWFTAAAGVHGVVPGIPGIVVGGFFGYAASGFLWSSNNPYLKSIWFKMRCEPAEVGLNPAIAMIGQDANPIHIIYETQVDQDWGASYAPSAINTDSFAAAAQTIFDEGFGMSLQWKKQTDVESFCSEILDHIQATMFVNPRDGKLTLKLIRDDYDIETLPILTPDNCKITKFDRKAWGETVNEIVVTWTNPENEQEETVSAQNNANIALQGGIISDSRNYYGVRNADLALKLAFRDLAMSSLPLATYEIECDRTMWDLVPGGCVRLHYPEYGIDDVVLRIGKIDYGKPGNPAIKLSTVEDIFALGRADYEVPDDSQWEDPAEDPAALEYSRIMTAPGYFVTQALSAADLSVVEYPEVLAAVLASQVGTDTYAYSLYGESVLSTGSTVAELVGSRSLLGTARLPVALVAEATTVVETFGPVSLGIPPRVSGFVFIGNVGEQGHEIALIESYDDEDGWTLQRGVFDTVPRAWPSDTIIWFVTVDSNFIVTSRNHGAGETVRYKLLPSTSRGTLPIEEAPVVAANMTVRPHLPNRPANVVVGGVSFGTVDLSGSSPATVTATWANRNRTMEDGVVPLWTDGNVTPEAGQTTTIRLFSTSGTLLATHAGLTGTTFDIPEASWGTEAVADVRLYAVRDGLESLQAHTIRVKIRPYGWGDNWGNDWGGSGGEPDPGSPVPPDVPPDPDPGGGFPERPPWVIEN